MRVQPETLQTTSKPALLTGVSSDLLMLILNAWYGGNEAIYAYVFTPRAHAQSGVVVLSVSQSSKFWADHNNEGSKHFYTSLKQ